MATADEIQKKIAEHQQYHAQIVAQLSRDDQEIADAVEKQRLRTQLHELNQKISDSKYLHFVKQKEKDNIDRDLSGPGRASTVENIKFETDPCEAVSHCALDCVKAVDEGEIEWTIKGLSWLEDVLEDTAEAYANSQPISVKSHGFHLCYSPTKSAMGAYGQQASLAIEHFEADEYHGVTFRYTIWIKSKDRGYIQWGDSASVCTNKAAECMLFGPDVCDALTVPDGIFGMSHAQLLTSEWVVNDSLTAKLKIRVRPKHGFVETSYGDVSVQVPSSNRDDKLLQLFESGANSDVKFIVQGEEIQAHSQILSALSEVFQRQFSCGMQETNSKRVTIDDCEPAVFKAFLRYLYSSSFACFDKVQMEATLTNSSGVEQNSNGASSPKATRSDKLTVLMQVLALSHYYQDNRLLRWTERALCKSISVEDVCPMLCKAHLYEAKALETKCLEFIVANKNAVAKTVAFCSLGQDWPQVSLKITLRFAGVSQDASTTAMENQENARKRKRTD